MARNNGELTPTQQRIHDLLADGKPHTRDELQALLDDELAGPTAVYFHVTNLRRILQRHGLDITTTGGRGRSTEEATYRLVRHINID